MSLLFIFWDAYINPLKKSTQVSIWSHQLPSWGDDDARQMAAAEVVFPNTQFRLCIWNVNATIQAKLLPQIEAEADSMFSDSSDEERKKTIDETWKIFKKDWMSALRAKSLAIWLSNWKRFREDHENIFPSVIAYIQTDIVNNYAKQLVKCWTDRQHNWGIQATRRGGGQSLLKNELGTSRGDIKDISDKFRVMLHRTNGNIQASLLQVGWPRVESLDSRVGSG
jgi:hypothetical protein